MNDTRAVQYQSPDYLSARIALHRHFTPQGMDVWDFVWNHYVLTRGDHVLEVGCGTGAFWTHPSSCLPTDVRLTVTDASMGMVANARATLGVLPLKLRATVTDATALPFMPASYQVALAHFMLYHATDKQLVLRELRRVTVPSGWVGIVLTGASNMARICESLTEAIPGLRLRPSDAATFHADVAEPVVRSVFRAVRRFDYAYTMNVDLPDAIVEYARSLSSAQAAALTDAQWARSSAYVAERIRCDGGFRVEKSCSLFIAQA